MKIVALEEECLGHDVTLERLNKLGSLTSYKVTAREEIATRLKEADVAIINRCVMTKETIDECKNLKLVCITGTGTDMIDLPYVKERGLAVCNVRGYSTQSVAQHTFAMLFYLLEHMHYYDTFVKEGNYVWEVKQDYREHRFMQLSGKTFGICGLGAIGKRVAEIAKVFGCRIIYYSTSGKNANDDYERVDFETLLRESDVLSVHAPLTEESKGLFGYQQFCQMKPTAIFLNLGRGAIVKEEDLARALMEDKIMAAGLDVLIKEPMTKESPFFNIKDSTKLLITPHIAWSSREARQQVIDEICLNIEAFFEGTGRNLL